MSKTYSSSLLRGGNILTPDTVKLTNNAVVYKKRNKFLIGYDSITLPISKIASVEIVTGIISAEIVIKSFGSGEIRASNFSNSDAKEIKNYIEQKL